MERTFIWLLLSKLVFSTHLARICLCCFGQNPLNVFSFLTNHLLSLAGPSLPLHPITFSILSTWLFWNGAKVHWQSSFGQIAQCDSVPSENSLPSHFPFCLFFPFLFAALLYFSCSPIQYLLSTDLTTDS